MSYPIDLDSETIQFDGQWYSREDLARRIKAMLDAGDFTVTRPSQALEQLTQTLASLKTVTFRVTPDVAEALNQVAAKESKTVGAVIRELLERSIRPAGAPAAPAPAPAKAAAPAPSPAPSAQSKAPPPNGPAPSVLVDPSVAAAPAAAEGAEKPKEESRSKEEEAIERRWFGG